METLTAVLRELAGFVISPMVWGLPGSGWRGFCCGGGASWRPYGNMAMLEAALRETLGRLALRLGVL